MDATQGERRRIEVVSLAHFVEDRRGREAELMALIGGTTSVRY
jgi:hypothetical protein